MKDYIAAIDLGTTKIVALLGQKINSDRYKILANYEMPSNGIERGEVQNVLHVTDLIKSAVDEIKLQSGLDFSEIYIGIAGQHIKCSCESGTVLRDNADTEITQDEIDDLQRKMYSLRMEPGEDILHVIPQNYSVDEKFDIKEPVGVLGRKLSGNFHLVIGKTHAMDLIERCLNNEKVNMKLGRLILEPLASAAAVLDNDEKEAGVVLVDIGGGTTDLVIYYDNIVRHTAVIPFGGNVVTEDIREGCGVLKRQAESLKVQFGSCLGDLSNDKIITIPGISGRESKEISFKNLSQIIDARMEEILGAIMFEIERSGFGDKLNAGIVFTGGGSMLTNFKQFAELKTGLDARIGKPIYLSSDTDTELALPAYSTAIGLIIKGIEYENSSIHKKQETELVEVITPVVDVDIVDIKDKKKKKKEKQIKDENTDENQQEEKGGLLGTLKTLFSDFKDNA